MHFAVNFYFSLCGDLFLFVLFPLRHPHVTEQRSNDLKPVVSRPLVKPPPPPTMTSSQSCPLSINSPSSSSTDASVPHSPSQPMSLTSEPQSEVDMALRILSSSSSLQSESARVMPLPGHALSALGINNLQHESSTSQVTSA